MAQQDLKEINDQLLEILRHLMAIGNWNASLFLRTANKKLQDIYDEALILSEQFKVSDKPDQALVHRGRIEEGYVLVYVSIYQADSYNMAKWETTLKNIQDYSIARPIYSSEEHIQEAIRAKSGSANEGYVIIYIKKSDIIPPYPGKLIEDRWGHELLTIRDQSLRVSNIVEFVHRGKHYELADEKLLLKSDAS
jgi:Dot/Icm secretion system protein IcmQ